MFFIPVSHRISRSRPRPKPACGVDPYRRRSRYHQYSAGLSPHSTMRRSSTSRRSSRWLPPMISPMPGTSRSIAATVVPSPISSVLPSF